MKTGKSTLRRGSGQEKRKFINCRIDVSKKVFAPRVETEFWVKKALEILKRARTPFHVLDIFSGSGCIGISVLRAIKNITVDFVDIDKNAVDQIKINLKLNRIPKNRYRVYLSDMFGKLENIKPDLLRNQVSGAEYDFIFANPPYVALDRFSEVQKEVLEKEPLIALFAGRDGMVAIERFFLKVKKFSKPNGAIFMEFDPLQKKKIKEIIEKSNFRAAFKKDQFKKDRWFVARAK